MLSKPSATRHDDFRARFRDCPVTAPTRPPQRPTGATKTKDVSWLEHNAKWPGRARIVPSQAHRPGNICNSSVSYTHLRAHETDSYLVCRLLLEKKKKNTK